MAASTCGRGLGRAPAFSGLRARVRAADCGLPEAGGAAALGSFAWPTMHAASSRLPLSYPRTTASPWSGGASSTRPPVSAESSSLANLGRLLPVRLRGFVPLMPFFTGIELTPSELSCPDTSWSRWLRRQRHQKWGDALDAPV
jgi:hypothetical protein